MMERLDGPLADLVAAEKDEMKELEARPRSRDAAWAGIAAAWAPAPPPTPPPSGAAEVAATSGKAGVLKLVAALVVGSSVAAGTWVASRGEAPPPIERVEAPAAANVAVRPEPPPPPSLPEVVPPPPAPSLPDVDTPPSVTPKAIAKAKPAPSLGLAEELALIDAMRKDVSAGRYAEAIAGAKQHRESFAKGSLTADRLDLEAAARCGRGELEAGRALADNKIKRWPRAPISERLRTLCRLDQR